jgi:hypothetical protein
MRSWTVAQVVAQSGIRASNTALGYHYAEPW